MDFLKSISIAASGLRAQAGRMRILAENLANADSTPQGPGTDPYCRRVPTFRSEVDRALDARVVAMGRVRTDQSDFRLKHEPGHPSADANGNVRYPNVNPMIENDRHARGPALLRGQHQRHRRDPPHDPAHARNPQNLTGPEP